MFITEWTDACNRYGPLYSCLFFICRQVLLLHLQFFFLSVAVMPVFKECENVCCLICSFNSLSIMSLMLSWPFALCHLMICYSFCTLGRYNTVSDVILRYELGPLSGMLSCSSTGNTDWNCLLRKLDFCFVWVDQLSFTLQWRDTCVVCDQTFSNRITAFCVSIDCWSVGDIYYR
jgi:hypothetical protein